MKYIYAFFRRIISLFKICLVKLFHFKLFFFKSIGIISISTKFVFLNKGVIKLGKDVATRRNVEFRVERGNISIGDKSFFNNNCLIVCHSKIYIGNNCSFGPNVMIFDHDHDFRYKGGKNAGKFKTSSVIIGNNVWVGANTVILRGTTIGDNCVIGAGG